jgi:hypothetical protein
LIQDLFKLYAATAFSQGIRQSSWAFAVIEMLHLVALAVLCGALLVASLAVSGVAFRFAGRTGAWRGLRPVFYGAFAAALASGVLLVGSNPMKYFFNDAFRWKMGLLAAALALTLAIDRFGLEEAGSQALVGRIAAILGLFVWLSVGVAGRLIGLL